MLAPKDAKCSGHSEVCKAGKLRVLVAAMDLPKNIDSHGDGLVSSSNQYGAEWSRGVCENTSFDISPS